MDLTGLFFQNDIWNTTAVFISDFLMSWCESLLLLPANQWATAAWKDLVFPRFTNVQKESFWSRLAQYHWNDSLTV